MGAVAGWGDQVSSLDRAAVADGGQGEIAERLLALQAALGIHAAGLPPAVGVE